MTTSPTASATRLRTLAMSRASAVEGIAVGHEQQVRRKTRLGALPLGGALLGQQQPRQQRRIKQVGCHIAQPA